ncbi:hypothetical protein HHK36_003787 [Tetracentron sinense]|uniref:Fe2OG dioxygenase domain-containing protein n=1 Tax=Tetracentron sinense TaxID=13715 RepID=A0A834ZT46_TETSI|nr:hypothetical protein HHK36_003787 [Tetracentron sinense]
MTKDGDVPMSCAEAAGIVLGKGDTKSIDGAASLDSHGGKTVKTVAMINGVILLSIMIVNHGIKISLMEDMLRSVDGFFSLPLEEKMKYASDDVRNPVRYGTSLNTSVKPLYWRDYLKHSGHPLQNSFHMEVAKEYLEEVWKLALKILGAISEGLGLDSDYIEKSLGEGNQIVISNYYPPCPEPHPTLGIKEHSVHSGLTIEILSNGKYKSVEHRGVVDEKRTRISIAVGHRPELTAIVAPASELLDEKCELKFTPILYNDYVRSIQSSDVRGKSPLEAIKRNI